VAPEIDQFWNLVAQSQLLSDEQYRAAKNECQESDSVLAVDWLVEKKLISPLHRDVLLAGHAGPFSYGRYVVRSRLRLPSDPSGFQSFAAIDRKTGYPVRLQFFDGQSPGALETWASIDQRARDAAEKLVPESSPDQTLEIYQALSLPETRFVVREQPRGKSLAAAVPLKSRLEAQQAAKIVAQATAVFASEMAQLDDAANEHDTRNDQTLSMPLDTEALMNRLWIGPGNRVRFDPLLLPDASPADKTVVATTDQQSQAFLLAALLLRLASGRPLAWRWDPKAKWFRFDQKQRDTLIAKLENQPKLQMLLKSTLCGSTESAIDVNEFARRLGKNFGAESAGAKSTGKRSAFLQSLGTLELALADPQTALVASSEPIPDIDIDVDLATTLDSFSDDHQEANDARVQAARTAAVKRQRARSKRPFAVATGLLLLGLFLGGWAFLAGGKSVPVVQLKPETAIDSQEQRTPEVKIEEARVFDYTTVSYVQTLVDDGEATLWEAPTTGLEIEFSWLPSGTEILLHLRGKELLAAPGGLALLKSLGPDFKKSRATFEQRAGLAIVEMDSLTVALVPNQTDGYKSFFQVVASGVTREQLVGAWGQPDEIQLPSNRKLFAGDDDAWCFIDMPDADSTDVPLKFVFGEPRVVQQVVQDNGIVALPEALDRLARRTDRQRHATLLALANALVNENARGMWGQWSERLIPALRLRMPDEVRAFSVGLHVDDGEYVEFNVDHSADISSEDLAVELRETIAEALSKVEQFSQSLARTEYWQRLQNRFGLMLQELNTAVRWDTEFGHLIGNAWLPPNAAQNLLSGSELTMTFSNSIAVTEQEQLPSSIEELLATKRSLNVTNPPDLNVLLSDIRAEIMDDYPGLGFSFQIKLMGSDLQKDGITQNQRPGPLAIVDQPLSAILTQIMTSANPDKTISGPADPNCKLVWVLAKDPEDEANKAILITTRAAAKEKDYSLPSVFVEK